MKPRLDEALVGALQKEGWSVTHEGKSGEPTFMELEKRISGSRAVASVTFLGEVIPNEVYVELMMADGKCGP